MVNYILKYKQSFFSNFNLTKAYPIPINLNFLWSLGSLLGLGLLFSLLLNNSILLTMFKIFYKQFFLIVNNFYDILFNTIQFQNFWNIPLSSQIFYFGYLVLFLYFFLFKGINQILPGCVKQIKKNPGKSILSFIISVCFLSLLGVFEYLRWFLVISLPFITISFFIKLSFFFFIKRNEFYKLMGIQSVFLIIACFSFIFTTNTCFLNSPFVYLLNTSTSAFNPEEKTGGFLIGLLSGATILMLASYLSYWLGAHNAKPSTSLNNDFLEKRFKKIELDLQKQADLIELKDVETTKGILYLFDGAQKRITDLEIKTLKYNSEIKNIYDLVHENTASIKTLSGNIILLLKSKQLNEFKPKNIEQKPIRMNLMTNSTTVSESIMDIIDNT